MAKVVIPSQELILEDTYTIFNELNYPKKIIVQLYPKYLVTRDSITRKIINIIDIGMVKCLWTRHSNEMFGIKFQKNGQTYSIYTENVPVYEGWKETLRKMVLIADFHMEYTVTKQIGVGSFAKVLLFCLNNLLKH